MHRISGATLKLLKICPAQKNVKVIHFRDIVGKFKYLPIKNQFNIIPEILKVFCAFINGKP